MESLGLESVLFRPGLLVSLPPCLLPSLSLVWSTLPCWPLRGTPTPPGASGKWDPPAPPQEVTIPGDKKWVCVWTGRNRSWNGTAEAMTATIFLLWFLQSDCTSTSAVIPSEDCSLDFSFLPISMVWRLFWGEGQRFILPLDLFLFVSLHLSEAHLPHPLPTNYKKTSKWKTLVMMKNIHEKQGPGLYFQTHTFDTWRFRSLAKTIRYNHAIRVSWNIIPLITPSCYII